MNRQAVVAVMLAALGAWAQPAAPLPDAPENAAPVAAPQEPPAPVVNLNYSEQEKALAARVVEEAVADKIRQVNEAMAEEPEAPPAPAAAAVETPPREWSPLENTMRALFGLLVVLGLLFALAYLAKRFGKSSPLFAGSELGRVLGKVYLSPRASLHFVRTGGKVLVVGVTPNAISSVAEFEAAAFEIAGVEPAGAAGGAASETESFLEQFKSSLESIARATPPGSAEASAEEDGAEIAALREDVQRLQRYLQESVRGGDNP